MLKKYRLPILTVLIVLVIDQCSKLYIKSNYPIGEVCRIVGDWSRITFTENPGMAWGLEFGGDYGKLALSLFRIIAVFAGAFYVRKIVNDGEHKGFIICVSLILAGALGNILDSAFYGLIFGESTEFEVAEFLPEGGGYTGFLQGHVVDMFYFPIYEGNFPSWLPIWGGEHFEFFNAIFNVADMAISFGVGIILVFQNRFFNTKNLKGTKLPVIEKSADDSYNP
ncbi:MAG: lipoprotein signal peptidase [Bacteroidota bacterium]|jgi:signal peptidase II|nr:lipoprotein signal peptidase [Bacteroidota bacterium]